VNGVNHQRVPDESELADVKEAHVTVCHSWRTTHKRFWTWTAGWWPRGIWCRLL